MPSYGPNLAVNDIVQVTAVMRLDDQIGLNVFHYRIVAVGAASPLSLVIDQLEAFGTPTSTRYKNLLSAEAEFRGYLVRRIHPTYGAEYADVAGAGDGAVAGDALPRQTSGLISKKAAVPGRRKGGRFYIPFPSEGDNDVDGIPTDEYFTRLGLLADNLWQSLATGAFTADPCIAKIRSVAGVTTVIETRLISRCKPVQAWATQRRRGSFGRINTSPI